jgi:hypothetical protein
VGSGGCLLDDELGNMIDGYDEVIRFNRAPTAGFEKHVGSKTTLRVVNRPTFVSAPLKRWDDDILFMKKLRDQRVLVHGNAMQDYNNRSKHIDDSIDLYIFNHGNLIREINNFADYVRISNPRIGFMTIMAILFSDLSADLYGFRSRDGVKGLDHYWHPRPPHSWVHDVNAETQLLNILKQRGSIRIV